MFGLSSKEESFLRKLSTPAKIQDYLDSIPFNYERNGETCMSPKRVLREKKAHCIEGAILACTAFMLSGRKPLILNLKVDRSHDDDHIVVLFQEHGYWGALSKTNHAVLRYRDPVYKNIRELAMSYFNEYFLASDGKKTMRGFSRPINLRRFGTTWIAQESDLWNIAEHIYSSPHTNVIPNENRRFIRKAGEVEKRAAKISEWK
jgi:hypothetical protein